MDPESELPPDDDRRAFLTKCGSFALVTPPAVTFLLSTSMSSKAIAGSSGRVRDGGGGALFGVLGAGTGAAAVAGAPTPTRPSAPAQTAAPAQVSSPPPAALPPSPPEPVTSPIGERG